MFTSPLLLLLPSTPLLPEAEVVSLPAVKQPQCIRLKLLEERIHRRSLAARAPEPLCCRRKTEQEEAGVWVRVFPPFLSSPRLGLSCVYHSHCSADLDARRVCSSRRDGRGPRSTSAAKFVR